MTDTKTSAGELLRGAKSFGAIIDDPRALRIGFDRAVTDDHRAALLAAINAAIVTPPVAGAEAVREALLKAREYVDLDARNKKYPLAIETLAVIEAALASPPSGTGAEYPSKEAMMAAVELEIHAALGSVKTVVIGQMIQKAIDASTTTEVCLNEKCPRGGKSVEVVNP